MSRIRRTRGCPITQGALAGWLQGSCVARVRWVTGIFLLNVACSGGPAPGTPFPFSELPASDASRFAPAVPAPAGQGQCGSPPGGGTAGRTLALEFGEPLVRRVRVTFSDSDEPVRYRDYRGDIDQRPPHDDRTLIQIDFDTETVSVINRRDGASGISRFDFATALEAESLGVPRRLIELLRSKCG